MRWIEDAGLKVTLTSSDHATQLLYDVATELETIATLGTWVAPSANNVRFDDDTTNGCYELQFAANSFENGTSALLTIEDTSSPTFLDRELRIHVRAKEWFDLLDGTTTLLTSKQTGLMRGTTIATVNSTTEWILTAGASNNDAYNNACAVLEGGTETDEVDVLDYVGGTLTLTVSEAPSFTVAVADDIRIHAGACGKALNNVDVDVVAVKAKTDNLTFTVSGEVDANIESINAVPVCGIGTPADKWDEDGC